MRTVVDLIGRHLDVTVGAVEPEHFGWIGGFVGTDMPASSALTRELLDWYPTQPGLVDDLDKGHYFRDETAG